MSAGRGLCRVTQTTSILSRSFARSRLSAAPRPCISLNRPYGSPPQRIRLYSSQIENRDEVHDHEDVEDASEEAVDIPLEEQMLDYQNASIAELEQYLGKSLEQAVLQDGLADRLKLSRRHEVDDEDQGFSVEDHNENQRIELELLRFQQSSPEEVAREARSIFGDYLPDNALKPEELVIYKRLYGAPVMDRDLEAEGGLLEGDEYVDPDQPQGNTLLDVDGNEITYHLEEKSETTNNMDGKSEFVPQGGDAMGTPIDLALTTGNRAAEVAMALEGEVVDEDLELEDDEGTDDTRSHPLTGLGRFATSPSTKFFSQDSFVRPIEKVMSDFSNKQLKDICEKTFGGPGLPDSALTPRSGRSRQQVPIPLGANQQNMGQMEANAFVTTVMPPTYASISAVLVETRKRLGSSWLTKLLAREGGPRILDAGSGGVGILAWEEIVQAHWDSLHSSDSHPPPPPPSKPVVLTGSDTLRYRAAKLLDNTTFVPRLPDYVNVRQTPTIDDERPVQQRKQFDVIISSHALFPLREEWERKQHVQNLWSLLDDDCGVLIIIEKGIPRGFETVAAAREMILERYIAVPAGQKTAYSDGLEFSKEVHQKAPGMIVAPCTNHERCPLYKTTGVSKGRKDICSFQQRYIRPPFLQRVLGARDRNHDDVDFSYVAIMKGDDLRTRTYSTWNHIQDPLSAPSAPESQTTMDTQRIAISEIQQGFEYYDPSVPDAAPPPPAHVLPRIMNAPIKRRGHVTMDLCTPQAEIRRWTVPKSFSRQAYRDARKSRWGDLWALGAKTSIVRNLKLGTPVKEHIKGETSEDAMPAKKPRGRQARLEAKVERAMIAEEAKRSEEELEEAELMRIIEEQNLLDEDEDEGLIDMDTLLPKKKAKSKPATPPTGASTNKSKQTTTRASPKDGRQQPAQSQVLADEPFEYTPGRIGQDDPLTAWADDIESVKLEEEVSRRLSKTGRRATARNTQRLKRELRRAQRENKSANDVD